jgi:predicted metal-dependent phosphoesterase TrpH
MCTLPILRRICRESYSDPLAVYETLKRRGMNLVTITDHDSIDGGEFLRRYPDFFLSEEVTCHTPSGTELHVGVYDIQERHHIELQRRRDDLPSLLAYLQEQALFFSLNHAFSGLTGRRTGSDFEMFEERFPVVETLNGQMLPSCNAAAAKFASRGHKAVIGGSDAHILAPLGSTYTEVAGVRRPQEFIEGLRRARGAVAGRSGNYWQLTWTAWTIGCELMRERPLAPFLFPLMAAVPLVTLANVLYEWAFTAKWERRLARLASLSIRPLQPEAIP